MNWISLRFFIKITRTDFVQTILNHNIQPVSMNIF
jgi:hypothetical protein